MRSRELLIGGRKSAISVVCQLRQLGCQLLSTNAQPSSARTLSMNEMSEYLTVNQLIDCLRATEADMKSASAHPPGVVLHLVEAAAVNTLRIFEVRQEAPQCDLTEPPDISTTAAEERKQAAKAARVTDQLHTRLRREKLSAEEIYQELAKSPRPEISRKLLTRDIGNDVVADDGRIVEARKGTGMIQCASQSSHTIHVRIASFPGLDTAQVAIVGIDAPGGLLGRWVGKLCTLKLPDPQTFLPMCLALLISQ